MTFGGHLVLRVQMMLRGTQINYMRNKSHLIVIINDYSTSAHWIQDDR